MSELTKSFNKWQEKDIERLKQLQKNQRRNVTLFILLAILFGASVIALLFFV